MAAPNMATITASLERSLQNCSLNQQQSSSSSGGTAGGGTAKAPEAAGPTLELNSEASLPFHWEQCLDLKTGELYFINWRTGMKAKEDPRITANGGYYSDDDSSSCDSENSYSESSPSSSTQPWSGSNNQEEDCYHHKMKENEVGSSNGSTNVLVVAGCKSCLMYYMVPKQLGICPKCCGQLLHFDRSQNGSS